LEAPPVSRLVPSVVASSSSEASTVGAGPWLAARADGTANGKDDRNALSPGIGWPSGRPAGDCPCFGGLEVCDPSSAVEEAAFAAPPGIESSMAANAKRSVAGGGGMRGAGAAITPETGAAAGAVIARPVRA
jgi:hypothetical protein